MFTARIRKVGNSLVLTIPKDEVATLGLSAGDFVGVELRKAAVTYSVGHDIRDAFERSWDTYRDDFAYLRDR